MRSLSNADILRQLHWRYATKAFDPARRIPEEDWATLENALRLAPSSYGIQPWRFVTVADPALRSQLREASWGQTQITDASHLVVLAVRRQLPETHLDAYVASMAETRGVSVESLAGFRKMIVGSISRARADGTLDEWMTRQVFIALGQLLTTAAMMGIDACPMEGFEPAKYDALLGLPALGLASVVVATLGYRADTDKAASQAKVRFPVEAVFVRR